MTEGVMEVLRADRVERPVLFPPESTGCYWRDRYLWPLKNPPGIKKIIFFGKSGCKRAYLNVALLCLAKAPEIHRFYARARRKKCQRGPKSSEALLRAIFICRGPTVGVFSPVSN